MKKKFSLLPYRTAAFFCALLMLFSSVSVYAEEAEAESLTASAKSYILMDAASGEVTKIALSGSNVLRFELCDGTHIVVRPSGTEPKIKVYILTKGADASERDANLVKYSAWVNTLA